MYKVALLNKVKIDLRSNKMITDCLNKKKLYKCRVEAIVKLRGLKKNNYKEYSYKQSYDYLNSIRRDGHIDNNYLEFNQNIKYDLSIIIPAYNVEKYIEDCIESIISQKTDYSYEIIIINDGSKDKTLELLNKYKHFENITIINKENCGISSARNDGINISKGKYIMFLDSDDVLLQGSIEVVLQYGYKYNADIVEADFKNFTKKEELIGIKADKECKVEVHEYEKNSNFVRGCKGFPWGKIYNRDLWREVRFPEGLQFEDTIIKLVLCRNSKKYITIDNTIYGYRYNPTSITRQVGKSVIGLDSLYIMLHLLSNKYNNIVKYDEMLYLLTIEQLSKYLYNRVKNFNDNQLFNILVLSKYILLSIEKYRPSKLGFWLDNIEDSILNLNLEKWKLFSNCI